jgi:hypothetical protein
MEQAAMTNYEYRKGYLAGDKHCLSCGAEKDSLRLLNPKGEYRGGVERIYYRCSVCKDYLMECWINGKLKTVFGS